MLRTRARISFPWRRRRARRGTPRLLADLAALERLEREPGVPARERLAAELPPALLREAARGAGLRSAPRTGARRAA